jgi:hypothetical protein
LKLDAAGTGSSDANQNFKQDRTKRRGTTFQVDVLKEPVSASISITPQGNTSSLLSARLNICLCFPATSPFKIVTGYHPEIKGGWMFVKKSFEYLGEVTASIPVSSTIHLPQFCWVAVGMSDLVPKEWAPALCLSLCLSRQKKAKNTQQ